MHVVVGLQSLEGQWATTSRSHPFLNSGFCTVTSGIIGVLDAILMRPEKEKSCKADVNLVLFLLN